MIDKMKQLYDLQKKGKELQKELKATEIEAAGAAGQIVAIFNAEMHLKSIKIDPSWLVASRQAELERELQKTLNEGLVKAQTVAAAKAKDLMGGLGLNIPGLG